MEKYLIMIGCAILIMIGLIIRQWFIGSSLKKSKDTEDENYQITAHNERPQAYSDLTNTGIRIKLKWIQAIYLGYAILYIHYSVVSWDAVATYMTMSAYKIMSIFAVLYTIVIMIYNFKFESRKIAKSACYAGTVGMLFGVMVICIRSM